MASNIKDVSLPLLDPSAAAVNELISTATKRGYVTLDQINSVLLSKEPNSKQIKDILSIFNEIGINVIETEWPAPGSEDTELGVFMGPEVSHGATKVYTRVQA